MASPLPTWKKGLGISLALSVAASLFIFVYYFEEETLESLLFVRAGYLLLAVLLIALLCAIEGLRIKLLVSSLGKRRILGF